MTRTKWFLALLGGVLSSPFMSPLSGVSASTKDVLPLRHVVQSSPAFRPSVPVPTTVEVSLPQAKKATVVFEFHPSTHPTSVRLVGQNRGTTARACASDGVDNTGSWSKYWSGCINIPTRGALLPADDGLSHVGVAVHVTSPVARLKGARLVIKYLPGDYAFSEVALSPRPSVAAIAMTTASPVLLGTGVDSQCGGEFSVNVGTCTIVKTSVEQGIGTWVNELPVKGSTYRFSVTHLRCRGSGENVGLGIATGSPGGP